MKIYIWIIVALLIASGLVIFKDRYFEENYIEFEGVKIKYSAYEAAKEVNKDNFYFYVCNIESEQCIKFTNINKLKEELGIGS